MTSILMLIEQSTCLPLPSIWRICGLCGALWLLNAGGLNIIMKWWIYYNAIKSHFSAYCPGVTRINVLLDGFEGAFKDVIHAEKIDWNSPENFIFQINCLLELQGLSSLLLLFLLWSNLRNPFMNFVISPCGGEGRDRFRLIKTEKETKI